MVIWGVSWKVTEWNLEIQMSLTLYVVVLCYVIPRIQDIATDHANNHMVAQIERDVYYNSYWESAVSKPQILPYQEPMKMGVQTIWVY